MYTDLNERISKQIYMHLLLLQKVQNIFEKVYTYLNNGIINILSDESMRQTPFNNNKTSYNFSIPKWIQACTIYILLADALLARKKKRVGFFRFLTYMLGVQRHQAKVSDVCISRHYILQ